MNCDYLSDLHKCNVNHLYKEISKLLNEQQFNLDEWSYSLSYIFDQSYSFYSQEDIINTLKKQLMQ